MTNTKLLREKIAASGYKLSFVAEKAGFTYQSLLNKMTNKSEFRANEIVALSDLLGINLREREQVFFSRDVDK